MTFEVLRAKLHRATITRADLHYVGSISIDPALYTAAGLYEFEKVDVLNINNGARLTTYIIKGAPGEVCLNGAAARLAQPGDTVIIASYATVTEEEAQTFRPKVVVVNKDNGVEQIISY